MKAVGVSLGALCLLMIGCRPSMEARSAGEVGCSPDEITISDDRYHFGLVQTGESWVVDCRGRTFVCSQLNETGRDDNFLGSLFAADEVSCTEQPESPQEVRNREAYAAAQRRAATVPSAAAPIGGAGFEFGWSADEARRACEAAGNQWTPAGAELGQCSGPARPLGISGGVSLRFCDDEACGISFDHHPTSAWSSSVAALKTKLEGKYGAPSGRPAGIPENCRSEGAFVGCLERRELELRYGWTWPSGERIDMRVGKPDGEGRASIRLSYRRGGSSVHQSAL